VRVDLLDLVDSGLQVALGGRQADQVGPHRQEHDQQGEAEKQPPAPPGGR
jgi:hypothetical protein